MICEKPVPQKLTVLDEDGYTLHECNDCGVLIWEGLELCARCQEREDMRANERDGHAA